MATVLLTGAAGFLGKALLAQLAPHHTVLTIGRGSGAGLTTATHYRGLFYSFEDLRQLDAYRIDAVVHLAAVTGGCLEREGLEVNVEGTRVLMRYLIDRGCRKLVLASSTAVTGFQSPDFRPLHLPISDTHPCLDRDGYGFSKYLMEETTHYLHRQNPQIDVINLRLAAIYPDGEAMPKVRAGGTSPQWGVGMLTRMSRSKAVEALVRALEAPHKAGVRTFNAVSRKSWVADPLAQVLRSWWGDFDLGSLTTTATKADPALFDSRAIEAELGFIDEGE